MVDGEHSSVRVSCHGSALASVHIGWIGTLLEQSATFDAALVLAAGYTTKLDPKLAQDEGL